eukprot:jgi/Ulvmu1/1962/UM012_0123.1
MSSYVLVGHVCVWATAWADVKGEAIEVTLPESGDQLSACFITCKTRRKLHAVTSSSSSDASVRVELALARLASTSKCRSEGCVLTCTAVGRRYICKARLDLYVRSDVLKGLVRLDANRAAADVFALLLPATDATRDSVSVCPECAAQGGISCLCRPSSHRSPRNSQSTGDDHGRCNGHCARANGGSDATEDVHSAPDDRPVPFKLHECFEELPNLVTTPVDYPPPPPRKHPGQPSALEVLPIEALHRIAELSLDISALACTCRLAAAVCAEVSPDLLSTLHSHQRAAMRSMMAREEPPQQLPHPFIRELPLPGAGTHVYADCASGHLSEEPPQAVRDVRGGLFCDEPGLGKTATALAVILKTASLFPRPPAGVEVRTGVARDPDGLRPVHGEFYMACVNSLVAEARDVATGGTGAVNVASEGAEAGHSTRGERQSRKERAAVQTPSLMLSRRNRVLLEDLDLIPPVDAGGQQGADVLCAALAQGGEVPGYVTEAEEGFVGGAERNIAYFGDLFLQFCIARNVTPYALSEMPALRLLIERLRQRSVVIFPGGGAKQPRPGAAVAAGVTDIPQVPAAARARRSRRAATAYGNNNKHSAQRETPVATTLIPQLPGEAITLCRPHGTARITIHSREVRNWMKALPQPKPPPRPHNGSAAAAAAAAAAVATELGMSHSAALLTALGLVPANITTSRGPADADEARDAAAEPPQKRRKSGHTGPSPVYMLPDSLRNCSTHRFDFPALAKALVATSDAYARVAAHEPVPLSPATLVVVPSILVDHWRHEIAKHVRPGALRVYYLEGRRDADVAAHRLAWDYDVVITTFTHLSSHGSAAHMHDRNLRHVVLQVHWLRMILDEGHVLGRSAQTNRGAILSAIRAERRWVMTGTPAPHTAQSRAAPLLPLLSFLRCQPFHGPRGALAFDAAIRSPFEAGRLPGKQRLMAVLRRVMIRSSKAGVTESRLLPPCTRATVRLQFDPQHQASYNSLVEVVLRNLLLADWFDEGHKESILHPGRSKWAAELLSNMRLACSVAGQANIESNTEDVLETLQILARTHGYDVPEGPATHADMVPPSHPLAHVETALRNGGPCDACAAPSRMILATPCAHVLCVDCTAKDSHTCCVCGAPYRQQPVDDPARRAFNSNPRAPVPIDLIELQPVFHQRGAQGSSGGGWQPQWEATRSTKCDYLIRRLRELHIVPPAPPAELPHWDVYTAPDLAGGAAEAAGAAGGAAAAAAAPPAAAAVCEAGLLRPGEFLPLAAAGVPSMVLAAAVMADDVGGAHGADLRGMPQATPHASAAAAASVPGAGARTRKISWYQEALPGCNPVMSVWGGRSDSDTDDGDGDGDARTQPSPPQSCGATSMEHACDGMRPLPSCMNGGARPASILRASSAFPRPDEYVPGRHEVFTPPRLCPKPHRGGRRRSHRMLMDVEVAVERHDGKPAAGGAGEGGTARQSVLARPHTAAAGATDALRAEIEHRDKAIVYCAFWQHLRLVEKHLADAHAQFEVLKASMSRAERAAAISAYRHGPVRVLVMDSVGAVGLDLSCTQHVFLMEPLGDLALEQQVVSRAHRLGATRAVHAEVLVMKGSIEDDLVSVSHGQRTQKLQEASNPEDSFVSQCQAEFWAKMEGQAEGMGRPVRNLLLTSLKRVKTQHD